VREEGSTSFFEKKEAKKRLLTVGCGSSRASGTRSKSFLLLFFKKEALSDCTIFCS
jgi:fructoselysine-6-P-deglycase FrlB-like protein